VDIKKNVITTKICENFSMTTVSCSLPKSNKGLGQPPFLPQKTCLQPIDPKNRVNAIPKIAIPTKIFNNVILMYVPKN